MVDETSWLQLALEVDAAQTEHVEDALLAVGAVAVTLVDAADQNLFEQWLHEKPLWDRVRLTGLFPGEMSSEDVLAALAIALQDIDAASWQAAVIPDEDWHRSWMDRYEPLCFGERLWVCPNWKPVPPDCKVPLMLDPGRAFGTGTHPTTAMCLSWLDAQDLSGLSVLDFGCGSGILAIAALLLGAQTPVVAVDNDPVAMQAVLENAALNNIDEQQIQALVADTPSILGQTYDLVLANILAAPLIALAKPLSDRVRSGGQIVLSGLLADQSQAVQSAYSETMQFSELIHEDGWVLLHGVKL